MVERSFLVTIFDNAIPQPNRVFQVVLERPVGGGTLGAQSRTNVTILDDDSYRNSPYATSPTVTSVITRAGNANFTVPYQTAYFDGSPKMVGGDIFLSVLENDYEMWRNPNLHSYTNANSKERISTTAQLQSQSLSQRAASPGMRRDEQRQSNRIVCGNIDHGNGNYTAVCRPPTEQGKYQLRIWHASPGGLRGDYYKDTFLQQLGLTRIDRCLNFSWGMGPLLPYATDYVSVRWSGLLYTLPVTGTYYFGIQAEDQARIWLDGRLILDHWDALGVNLEPPRPIPLTALSYYEIIVDYRHMRGPAHFKLLWGLSPSNVTVIPSTQLFSLIQIRNTPVLVTVVSAETWPNSTECFGPGIQSAVAGGTTSFSFCPHDRYYNARDDDDVFYLSTELYSATATLVDDRGHHGDGAEVLTPYLVYDSAQHCFVGTYTAHRAGVYSLAIGYTVRGSSPVVNLPLPGSPFLVPVSVSITSGAYSEIRGLGKPQQGEAGVCYSFAVIARDVYRNYRFLGGDDFEVRWERA